MLQQSKLFVFESFIAGIDFEVTSLCCLKANSGTPLWISKKDVNYLLHFKEGHEFLTIPIYFWRSTLDHGLNEIVLWKLEVSCLHKCKMYG